jgi:hypothetical protein
MIFRRKNTNLSLPGALTHLNPQYVGQALIADLKAVIEALLNEQNVKSRSFTKKNKNIIIQQNKTLAYLLGTDMVEKLGEVGLEAWTGKFIDVVLKDLANKSAEVRHTASYMVREVLILVDRIEVIDR